MPTELLTFTPAYCIVGAYRLVSDKQLWYPMWQASRRTIKLAALISLGFIPLSYPVTRLYVHFFMTKSLFSPDKIEDARMFGLSVEKFVTLSLVLGQISMALEWALRRDLSKARKDAYAWTVKSRGKDATFWAPYVEEWKVPPVDRAERNKGKHKWYKRLQHPIFTMFILRALITPVSWVPFLSLFIRAFIRSLTMGRDLHTPYFVAKGMSPDQIELFLVERLYGYRLFGFASAVLEKLPIVGIVASISNRIGAAMWAHDLEKRQHEYASGLKSREKVYESKLANLPKSDLPQDFAGSFPVKKLPVGTEERKKDL